MRWWPYALGGILLAGLAVWITGRWEALGAGLVALLPGWRERQRAERERAARERRHAGEALIEAAKQNQEIERRAKEDVRKIREEGQRLEGAPTEADERWLLSRYGVAPPEKPPTSLERPEVSTEKDSNGSKEGGP